MKNKKCFKCKKDLKGRKIYVFNYELICNECYFNILRFINENKDKNLK